jgi:hypothetical protein
MEKWTYRNCTLVQLEKEFALDFEYSLPSLSDWLDLKEMEIEASEHNRLLSFQKILQEKVDDWNKQELCMNFISPFLLPLFSETKDFNWFMKREISAIIKTITFRGEADMLLSNGLREPKNSYFFLQTYKPEFKHKHDFEYYGEPRAQNLALMLISQTLNSNDLPIYGSYVKGRSWYFMVLEGGKYAISKAYDATQDDIFDIFKILKKLKVLIEKRLENK